MFKVSDIRKTNWLRIYMDIRYSAFVPEHYTIGSTAFFTMNDKVFVEGKISNILYLDYERNTSSMLGYARKEINKGCDKAIVIFEENSAVIVAIDAVGVNYKVNLKHFAGKLC